MSLKDRVLEWALCHLCQLCQFTHASVPLPCSICEEGKFFLVWELDGIRLGDKMAPLFENTKVCS